MSDSEVIERIVISTWDEAVHVLNRFSQPYEPLESEPSGSALIEQEKDGTLFLLLELRLKMPKLSLSKHVVAPISDVKH